MSNAIMQNRRFEKYIVDGGLDTVTGNYQIRTYFPNGYGASIVIGPTTYGGNQGLGEVAVIKYQEDGNWELDYTTPITNDVLGYLSSAEIIAVMDSIFSLPKC